MTLEELENTLPNGLHDAEVRSLAVDYQQRTVTFEVAVWIGNMGDPPERREAYKNGKFQISGLLFLVMDPPASNYPFKAKELTVDLCDASKNIDQELIKSITADYFFRSLWVNEWNAFIHIAARCAEIVWINGGEVTYRLPRRA